jgi:hypothetical protein
MKYLTLKILGVLSFLTPLTFFVFNASNFTLQELDSSITKDINRVVDSINLYIDNNNVASGIACGSKGSWSDYRNEKEEVIMTKSNFLIADGVLLTKKYFESEKVILAEMVFINKKWGDTLYWEDRYFSKKGFYSEAHIGSIGKLSLELSNHIKKYHYNRE